MTTTDTLAWSVGERLRAARRRAGMKQADVARRLHVGRSTLSNWEVGIAEPQITQAAALAALYDVPLEWIASGKAERQDSDPPIILGSSSDLTVSSDSPGAPVRAQRLTRWELEQRRWNTHAAA